MAVSLCVACAGSGRHEGADAADTAADADTDGDVAESDARDAEGVPDLDAGDASVDASGGSPDAGMGPRDAASDARADASAVDAGPGTKAYSQLIGTQLRTCALDSQRAAYCWGGSSERRPTLLRSFALRPEVLGDWDQLAVDHPGYCGVRAGKLYCWGQLPLLGTSQRPIETHTPLRVGSWEQVHTVSIDVLTACVIPADRSLHCWGDGTYGQLGRGESATLTTCSSGMCGFEPARVGSANDWQASANGHNLVCGIRAGTLFCWGVASQFDWRGAGAVEACPYNGTPVGCYRSPQPVFADHDDWVEVGIGFSHVCARRQNGEVYCRGGNINAQLGGPNGGANPVGNLSFSQLAVGREHSCGVVGTRIYCWGSNKRGQLGDGKTMHAGCTGFGDCSPAAVEVTHPRGKGWRMVVAGYSHSCALDVDGLAFCWGGNDYNQLGIGDRSAGPAQCGSDGCAYAPVQVFDPSE